MTKRFESMAQVRAANKALGHTWFGRYEMRFFNTRICTGVLGGRYFVTAERMETSMPERFTIREAMPDGSVETIGDFQQYSTQDAARAVALSLR